MNRISQRRGFSLLEMLLALAILGGSLAAISTYVEIGTDAAIEARQLSSARIQCQTKLAEVLLDAAVGITPQSVAEAEIPAFDSQSTVNFSYSLEVLPAPIDGLLAIRVTVQAENPSGGPALATCSLSRWMVDPSLDLEQAALDEEALKEEMAGGSEGR